MLAPVNYRKLPEVHCSGFVADVAVENTLEDLDKDRILHFRDTKGNTYLHAAIMAGTRLPVLRGLMDSGLDLNVVNGAGETVLFLAVHYGKETLVKLLLERGADPNLVTHAGLSPLMVAVENGHMAVVRMLLAHGAKPCEKSAAA